MLTPNSRPLASRSDNGVAATPIATPIAVNGIAWPTISVTMSRRPAPSAIRIAISFARAVVEYAITP